ncbi:iron complex transport system ATP-binding protein [Promicromonospora umidemergens]|uniref:Siderophore ABC transporter ATP-binding protein CdtA n=1 Tax=Promicromonospora umidemergens TaxID=629679 RepID=A0ABP8XCD2_9MICO|nr:ABC transporter ATP-binding protein [Promicromonospora umidemergens]MCP2281716.1 iron complex transport system ATP-binding protein [Promicromonospora umidemergens]
MTPTALRGDDLVLGYQRTTVVHGVVVHLTPGVVTALVGPNGSGKSTVLRSLARLHPVRQGTVNLGPTPDDAVDAAPLSAREFARRVTLLAQSRPHPAGLAVRDVVAFGRHPHRRRFAPLADADHAAIDRAMEITGVAAMARRGVDQLSGGEVQRVWLATCLAQETGVVLLDEPTNHLDLRYQVETLDLVRDLAEEHGTAVGIVLHDLDHAASVADAVVLLHQGRVLAAGPPAQVLTAEHLSLAYGLPIDVTTDPGTGRVRVHPRGRHHGWTR